MVPADTTPPGEGPARLQRALSEHTARLAALGHLGPHAGTREARAPETHPEDGEPVGQGCRGGA